MNREYHKTPSSRLGRAMELLVFGHAGQPVIVFPASGGRFYQFENCGMVAALAGKIEAGQLQLFCVDSVDNESWYNRSVHPRLRIARHMQYDEYIRQEIVSFVREKNDAPMVMAAGCGFGGYHAVNIALRHPDVFGGFLSMSGAFELHGFLDDYLDQNCYHHLPTQYLPHLDEPWYLNRIRKGRYTLASGQDDHCLEQNQKLDNILQAKNIPHQFYVWEDQNSHDWPTWRKMVQVYL